MGNKFFVEENVKLRLPGDMAVHALNLLESARGQAAECAGNFFAELRCSDACGGSLEAPSDSAVWHFGSGLRPRSADACDRGRQACAPSLRSFLKSLRPP